MTFTVRDLMFDVLPATIAEADKRWLACTDNTIPPPKPRPGPGPGPRPGPKPKPEPRPGCTDNTMGGPAQSIYQATAELAPLELLREQLHQALHP